MNDLKQDKKLSTKSYLISSKYELLRKAKDVNVPIYGSIGITLMAQQFMDNRYFQRLRDLLQLGLCEKIFIGAVHTRFEHSVGTYYLADRITTRIRNATDETKLTEWLNEIVCIKNHYESVDSMGPGLNMWICELIKIAALCHDLGHGPYSHLFDDEFIKTSDLKNHPNAHHEARSCLLVSLIIQESPILSKFMNGDDIKLIQSLINPPKSSSGFIYQILSNDLNALDVDKYDYLNRDPYHLGIPSSFDYARLVDSVLIIDNIITYPEQAEYDIVAMFTLRHAMHRRVYGHKGVVSAQYVIIGIMKIIDKVIGLTKSIEDMNLFCTMTDNYVKTIARCILQMRSMPMNPYKTMLTDREYENLEELMTRIDTHKMYPHIGTIVTKQRIDLSEEFKENDFLIHKSKVGLVSGNKENPLNNIYVYKTKEHFMNGNNVRSRKIDKREITHLLSETYQEYVTIVYTKSSCQNIIAKAKERFNQIKDLFRE